MLMMEVWTNGSRDVSQQLFRIRDGRFRNSNRLNVLPNQTAQMTKWRGMSSTAGPKNLEIICCGHAASNSSCYSSNSFKNPSTPGIGP